jgi:hypothetical protein
MVAGFVKSSQIALIWQDESVNILPQMGHFFTACRGVDIAVFIALYS